MSQWSGKRGPNALLLLPGLLLLGIGFLVLLGEILRALLHVDIVRYLSPVFVIVPGLVAYGLAFAPERKDGRGLAALGSAITATGLWLALMSFTGHWQSWTYAWALVGPGAIGVGLMLFGALKRRQRVVQGGRTIAIVGAIVFVVGALFFELIVGVGGFGLGPLAWPLLLLGVGALALAMGLARFQRST